MNNTKRSVFISYHHKGDQYYLDKFKEIHSRSFEIFTDRSLNESVRGDDHECVNRRIREEYIKRSTCTIVFCGTETHNRKYVDWEIHSTLHYQKALLVIALPTAVIKESKIIVPDRLYQNIESGYAYWAGKWDGRSPSFLFSELNQGLRPHLTKYQAKFRKWYLEEIKNKGSLTPQEVQKKYKSYESLIADIKKANKKLLEYAELIKELTYGK